MGVSLTLIDLSGIFFRHWHATKDMEVSEAYERTIADVHAYKGSGLCAVCCDSPPYWRSERIEGYKANREAAPPMAREQFRRVRDQLRADGLLLWAADTFEADDVIAWACAQALADEEIESVTVVSSDKDMLQLVNGKVAVRSPFHDMLYDADEVKTKLGVWPTNVPDYLAMVGDSSDNVPGVPGIGPKNASALIEAFGGLELIVAEAEKPEGESKITRASIKKALTENAAQAYLARSVIQLRTDVPLDWAELRAERTRQPQGEDVEAEMDGDEEAEDTQQPEASKYDTKPKDIPSSNAIVMHQDDGGWSLALEPRSSGGALAVAKALFNSRLVGKYPNVESVFLSIMRGRALGLDACTALAAFHPMPNGLRMHADLIRALVLRSGKAEYFERVESTLKAATFATKRKGSSREQTTTFTVEDAFRAGLVTRDENGQDGYAGISESGKPSNWDKYRATMLQHRCSSQLAREVYPDVVLGLYDPEEIA